MELRGRYRRRGFSPRAWAPRRARTCADRTCSRPLCPSDAAAPGNQGETAANFIFSKTYAYADDKPRADPLYIGGSLTTQSPLSAHRSLKTHSIGLHWYENPPSRTSSYFREVFCQYIFYISITTGVTVFYTDQLKIMLTTNFLFLPIPLLYRIVVIMFLPIQLDRKKRLFCFLIENDKIKPSRKK